MTLLEGKIYVSYFPFPFLSRLILNNLISYYVSSIVLLFPYSFIILLLATHRLKFACLTYNLIQIIMFTTSMIVLRVPLSVIAVMYLN